MFFRSQGGSWSLSSKLDPRWNCSGSSDNVGGFVRCQEAEDRIRYLASQYGEPPADLEYFSMKY
jgi:hypothetical protein